MRTDYVKPSGSTVPATPIYLDIRELFARYDRFQGHGAAVGTMHPSLQQDSEPQEDQ